MRRGFVWVVPVVGLAMVVTSECAESGTLSNVALEGGPSVVSGFDYVKLENPTVGDAGESVVFFADTKKSTPPSQKAHCIYRAAPPGTGAEVACLGDAAAGGGRYSQFGEPSVNASGTVAFDSRVVGGGPDGVFSQTGADPVAAVSLEGDPVPGGGTIKRFRDVHIADNGNVFFLVVIGGVDDSVDEAILMCPGTCPGGAGLVKQVQEGDTLPALSDKICEFRELAASDFGLAFRAATRVDCADGDEPKVRHIFRKPVVGDVVSVAAEGEASNPLPGLDGTTYASFPGRPDVSNNGAVVFLARTAGALKAQNIYLCEPGSCPGSPAIVAVAQGDLADGDAFKSFGNPGVSDAWDVVFSADLTGASVCGVYVRRYAPVSIETIARNGQTAPAPTPAVFRCPDGDPAISAAGDIAFRGTIRTTTPPKRNLKGIFHFE